MSTTAGLPPRGRDEIPDRELWQRYATAGDQAAGDALVQRYQPLVARARFVRCEGLSYARNSIACHSLA